MGIRDFILRPIRWIELARATIRYRMLGQGNVQRPALIARFRVTLYTREGCPLCEEAQEVLEKYGLAVQAIDIDRDPTLKHRYHDSVPVVVIDGVERFRGRVNEVLLKRLLASDRH